MPLSLTLQDALAQAQAQGLERIDAQLLLLHALGRADASRAWLLAHNSDALPADAVLQNRPSKTAETGPPSPHRPPQQTRER